MSVVKQYLRELHEKFSYFPTWLPNNKVKLGDVGVLENNVFTRITSLKNENIKFKSRKDKDEISIDYASTGSVSITNSLAGQIKPNGSNLTSADAGIIIEFGREKAVYFKADGVQYESIENMNSIEKEVLAKLKENTWKRDWVIINQLVTVKTATIIISDTKNGKIELKATANVDAPALNIADAKFGFSAISKSGINTQLIAENGLTPLYKCMGISGFFSDYLKTRSNENKIDVELFDKLEKSGKPVLDEAQFMKFF